MTLLLFNYALFNDPTLLIVGWLIAGLEAITAILHFIRAVFRNNKKIVERIDKSIAKCEKTLTALRQKQSEYRAVLAYEAVERGELNIFILKDTGRELLGRHLGINAAQAAALPEGSGFAEKIVSLLNEDRSDADE